MSELHCRLELLFNEFGINKAPLCFLSALFRKAHAAVVLGNDHSLMCHDWS
jgi:hypothetical protein